MLTKVLRKCLLLIGFFGNPSALFAQHIYTTANAHAHNDYEQTKPFWLAYSHEFGSIEADVFLLDNNLLVAHNKEDIRTERSLKDLYLKPLQQYVKKSCGFVYRNHSKKLILLIDIKGTANNTLKGLLNELKYYPDLVENPTIKFVISGNQPNKDSMFSYSSFIGFDGDLNHTYDVRNFNKIVLFSANFRDYSHWDGKGEIDCASKVKLAKEINKAHSQGKPIRFWGAPDNENVWKSFMQLGIDFINTDRIESLADFLRREN